MHLGGGAFDGITGNMRRIDQAASASNLTRLRINALIGSFPGAAIDVVSHDGPAATRITIVPANPDGGQPDWDASRSAEMQARVQRLLRDVYQRMDWFIER